MLPSSSQTDNGQITKVEEYAIAMTTVSGFTIRLPSRSQALVRNQSDRKNNRVYRLQSFRSILLNPALTEAEKEVALRELAPSIFPLKPQHSTAEFDRLVRFLKEALNLSALGPQRVICRCGQSLSLDNRTYYAWGNWAKHRNGRCSALPTISDEDKENIGLDEGHGSETEEVDAVVDYSEGKSEEIDQSNVNATAKNSKRQAMVQTSYPIPHIEPTAFRAGLGVLNNPYGTDTSRHPIELAEVLIQLATNLVVFAPPVEDKTTPASGGVLSIDSTAHDRRRASRAERRFSPMSSTNRTFEHTCNREIPDVTAMA
ncbi:hypothetical protein F5890DRAFT_150050 [Lentinula detonsa]|uniref:Uncharacterized protein n=1 Tax=Lentinula detonsa TaxID=2804962 RepID=A0AA38PY68_9AGAR|nr:hypothetical protein F5890DRAFT_150050 [Lentinula detonsa]